MYITYSDLIQIDILLVALASLIYEIFKLHTHGLFFHGEAPQYQDSFSEA